MKSLLKFTILSALIVGGKFAKQSTPAAPAQAVQTIENKVDSNPDNSVMLVHQVLTSEPVKPVSEQPAQPQSSGSGMIAEMF